MAQFTIAGTGESNPDGTLSGEITLTPDPVPPATSPDALGAISWHNASEQITQFNAAEFAAASSRFLSAAGQTWLNGLSKLSIELSFMMSKAGTDAVSNGLLGRWHYSDQGQFALDAQTNTGVRALRLWICDTPTATAPPAVNGTALILPYHFYHLVVVYDGTQLAANRVRFYLNGILDPISGGNGTIPTSLTTCTAPLHISKSIDNGSSGAGGDGFFNGAIWRVRFWPGESLTPSDAAALYNNRKGYTFANIPGTISAQPTQGWELSEASGNRASATGGSVMVDNGSTPSTGVTQVGELTGRGFLGVGIGSMTIPNAINGLPAFSFPALNLETMLDIGLPAGAMRPANCTVAAICSSADVTKQLNWVHASYDYSGGPLLNDINAWGGLIIDDNHETAQGSAATFYGDGTNGNVAESQTFFADDDVLRLIAVFTKGQPTPRLYTNGIPIPLKQSFAVYTDPPPTEAAGPAGNSFIGNMADTTYPGQADHYVRDLSLYDVALTPTQVAQLDAYLAGA